MRQVDHESVLAQQAVVPNGRADTPMQFLIIVCAYNVGAFIAECLKSIQVQTVPDWRCVVMDDCSVDDTATVAESLAAADPRIRVVRNTTKKFLLGNTAAAIVIAQPQPEDVVVSLDGDDWLNHARVLERLEEAYRQQDAWLTYGSYLDDSGKPGRQDGAYAAWVTKYRAFRWVRWRGSHLKTFKVWLWRNIRPEDMTISELQYRRWIRRLLWTGRVRQWRRMRQFSRDRILDPSGKFFRRCTDQTMMLPMLEMAGLHAVHIPDPIYVYRRPSGGSAARDLNGHRQLDSYTNRFIRLYLRQCGRYAPIQAPRSARPGQAPETSTGQLGSAQK